METLTNRQKEFLDKLTEIYKNQGVELRTIADIKDSHYSTLKQFNNIRGLWEQVNKYLKERVNV